MIPNIAGGQIAIKNNLTGLNFSMSTACSSATDAIGMAYRLISDGHISAMICGGAEGSITPLTLSGFANMKALSKNNDNPSEASKPFDKERDGFILSEGAGMLFLENLESALNRGAEILGEIIGYGITNDAYHITQPHKDSVGAISAIEMAINEADIKVEDIDYINAHGTSTYFNDMLETQAIKNVLGNHAKDVSISSTKSMTGHLLGAAGAIEAIACINAINYNKVPPTVNFKTPDPECNLNYTPNVAIDRNVEIAMSNSFGFGGHNSVIVLKKFSS
jgi:3-oxoacyl-[acyl-carrier-protein] synthase II